MSLVDALISRATVTRQPISGTFELTPRCNLSCKMCYIHNMADDPKLRCRELSTEQWLNLADQASRNGTLVLLLTGGEPMLRDDFCRIYRACAEKGFLLTINTNGTLISEEIFELFREHPPLQINVSLYGMSEKTYEELCGNGKVFHRVTANLKRLCEMGVAVQIHFSATPYNNQDVAAVCEFAKKIGARVKQTAYMFPPTRTDCRDCFRRFSPHEAAQVMVDYLRLTHSADDFAAYCRAKSAQMPTRLDDCGEVYDGVRCRAARASYWVNFEGEMLPCGMIPTMKQKVLELGFDECWRRMVHEFGQVKAPKGCVTCEHYAKCDVCPAMCYAENQDFSVVPKYVCEKNAAYRELLREIAKQVEE